MLGLPPGFSQKRGVMGVETAKTPTTLLTAGPALHLSPHSSLARSASLLALGRGQAFSQNRIIQVPELPHPRLWSFHPQQTPLISLLLSSPIGALAPPTISS